MGFSRKALQGQSSFYKGNMLKRSFLYSFPSLQFHNYQYHETSFNPTPNL